MKESKSCHTCQRNYYNLMSANCGHKICFHCVKSTRNTSKCPSCLAQHNLRTRTPLLSPARNVSNEPKQRSTKVKDSESKIMGQYSPAPLLHSRKSLQKSSLGWVQQDHQANIVPVIKCNQHQQPLTMYCKTTRQLICSMCVCARARLTNDIVPLRFAQDFLKKQSKAQRQQARHLLSHIQNASKIITKNNEIFQRTYNSGLKTLNNFFQQAKSELLQAETKMKQEFMSFFDAKFRECDEINQDLTYLNTVLQEYKDNSNKENYTFNELIYMFTSFKVIKNTIKTLNLDYIPYTKQIHLIETNHFRIQEFLKSNIRFKLDLPLKLIERRKSKSQSKKSVSKSKNQEWDEVHKGGHTGNLTKQDRENLFKKHQMSLCSNIHGIEMCSEQKNLYKMLLKTKFKL